MCARYLQDQNKVLIKIESGTYANTSGNAIWPGQVTEHTITDSENKIIDRFMGTAVRNYHDVTLGPRDVNGTLTFNMQDARMLFWAIGSVTDTSGTNSVHLTTEINTAVRQSPFTSGPLNPPLSFTIEDSKQALGTGQNFVRTILGCVPNVTTLSLTQGEKATLSVDYIGQTLNYSSGATTSLSQVTNTPYLWSNATLTVSGMVFDTAKSIDFEINQNIEPPHYLNGSRDIGVPYPKNRDYTLNVTFDLDAASDKAKTIYSSLYKTNSTFDTILDLNADSSAGSQHIVLLLSGCTVTAMENPSTIEGTTESTLTIMPRKVIGSSWDSTAATSTYNYGF